MKTLAQFKRDATSGKMRLEMIERYGSEEILERLKGIRKVVKVNSVGVTLLNEDGKESALDLKVAGLVEYDGSSLTVYNPGYRELTEEEKSVLSEWKRIEDEYYKENPFGDAYWRKKRYFKNSSCPWMGGFETVKGKYYDFGNEMVRDNKIKGDAILKYKVYLD